MRDQADGFSQKFSQTLIRAVSHIESLIGADWLNAQTHSYEVWGKEHSLPDLQEHLFHRPHDLNRLVPKFWAYKRWLSGGQPLDEPLPRWALDLAQIATSVLNVKAHCPELWGKAREFVVSRLRTADQVQGILHELRLAGELTKFDGCHVVPKCLLKGSEEEIEVWWRSSKVEIQCKTKVSGAGQRIHNDVFDELAGYLIADARRDRRQIRLKLVCNDRLMVKDLPALRDEARRISGPAAGATLVLRGRYAIQSLSVPGGAGGLSAGELAPFRERDIHRMLTIQEIRYPDEGRWLVHALIEAESVRPERRVRSVINSVRRAVQQASGSAPVIVALHFSEPISDWGDVKSRNHIYHARTQELMKDHPYFAGIIYSAEAPLRLAGGVRGDASLRYYVPDRLPEGFPMEYLLGKPEPAVVTSEDRDKQEGIA